MMLSVERRNLILNRLKEHGRVVASELSSELGVSEDTIRRDLRELAEQGEVQRVHGGALLRAPIVADYATREQQASEGKVAVARAAVGLVRDGQVICLDGGTTTRQVALALPPTLRATVITNSPPVAIALAAHPYVEVILVGGTLLKLSQAAVGPAAVAGFQSVRTDICFLGVCSLHPEVGITVPNWDESHVKRAMIAGAAEVVALATPEKLDTAVPYVVAPLNELTYLITTAGQRPETLAPYQALGINVIEAG